MRAANLPESLVDAVTEVLAIIADDIEASDASQLITPPPSTVAILGPRGSGKTTLLQAVCRSLIDQRNCLVLPILQPEVFESTDSLLLACLLNLEELSAHLEKPTNTASTGSGIVLSNAIRAVAASSAGAYQALLESRESAGQYSLDAASILRHRTSIPTLLEQAFQTVADRLGPNYKQRTIVPIDDADLSPGNLVSVMNAVRVLGSLPNVIPIITADLQQLETAMAAEFVNQYHGNLGITQASHLAHQVLAKMIRPERTTSTAWLTFEHKEQFVPLFADGDNLRGQLRRVYASNSGPNLEGVLWTSSPLTAPFEPMHLNAWLPSTPRELERLWYAIRNSRYDASEALARRPQRLQHLVDSMMQATNQFVVHIEPARAAVDASRKSLQLVWPNIQFGVASTGSFVRSDALSGVQLRVRRIASYTAALFPDPSSSDRDEQRIRLTGGSVSCVQALQELAITGVLGGLRDPGPTYVGEKEFEFFQSLRLNGEGTDDTFFSMPHSVGVRAMSRAAVAWNSLVEFAQQNRRDNQPDPTSFVRKYIQVVSDYWTTGDDAKIELVPPPSLADALEKASGRYFSLYVNEDTDHLLDYTIGKSYCHWFETILPQVFHSALVGEDMCKAAIEVWLDGISGAGRSLEAAESVTVRLRDRLDKRIEGQRSRKDGAHSWIYGYRDLAEAVDTRLFADVLLFEEAFREQRRNTAVGHGMLEERVELANAKGSYEFQPHPTAEGAAEMRILRDVLSQMGGR